MAVKLIRTRDLSNFQMVAQCDDALAEGSDYDAYSSSGDESKLKFKDGMTPTRFVLNLDFSGKAAEKIKNAMLGSGGDDAVKMTYGSWTFAVAKLALKEIVNPPDLGLEESFVMKKDGAGLAHDDLLAKLDRFGIVQNIFSLYQGIVLSPEKAEAKN